MPSKLHFSTYIASNIFILIIIVASSLALIEPVCKSVLLENCNKDDCIVDISVYDKCPLDYPDDETRKNCEHVLDKDLPSNNFLFIPVTNVLKSITYWNVYCAYCNNQTINKDFVFWNLTTYCPRFEGTLKSKFSSNRRNYYPAFISNADLAVMDKIHLDQNDELILNSENARRIFPLRQLPSKLGISSYQICPSNSVERKQFFNKINGTLFSFIPEDFNCSGKKECSKRKVIQPETCFYTDKNNFKCKRSDFLVEKFDFIYHGSEILLKNGEIFDSDSYINLTDKIYLCDSRPMDFENVILKILPKSSEYMIYVSAFLLIVFLAIKTNKENFKKLPDVILYSYCLASFLVYLYQISGHLLEDTMILRIYLSLYIYLCYAFWTLIISYEYWQLISTALRKRPNINMKKYRIYGFVGWILPILVVIVGFLLLREEDRDFGCPNLISFGFKNKNLFQSFSETPQVVHLIILCIFVMSFIILIPFLMVQIHYARRLVQHSRDFAKRTADGMSHVTRSVSEKDCIIVFTRIACLMGLQWMMIFISSIFSIIFRSVAAWILTDIGNLLQACHGAFLFFAFGWRNVRETGGKIWESGKKLSNRDSSG